MKDFFKYMLATMLAMVIMGVFAMVMSLVMLLSVAAAGEQKPVVKDGSVLRLSLAGVVNERAVDNPFAELLGNEMLQEQGLDQMLNAIKAARDNDKIKGMYIEAGALSADFAVMQELRAAIADFGKQKPVVAYGDTYTSGAYYVASAAQKVYINPSGMILWHGIASQPVFYKDLLEKVGVKMQVFRVGTYKSAVEPFTNTEMSPANRAQVESYINDIWGGICREVSASRNIPVDSLDALADRYQFLADADDYVKCGLVDSLTYVDGLRGKLREMAGTEKVNLVEAAEMAKLYEPAKADDKVAVYYAYGSIVDAATTGLGAGEAEIVGDKVVKDLDELMNNDEVKSRGAPHQLRWRQRLRLRANVACRAVAETEKTGSGFDEWIGSFGRLLHVLRCRLYIRRCHDPDRQHRHLRSRARCHRPAHREAGTSLRCGENQ